MKKVDIVKLWPLIIFTFALAVRFVFLNQFQNSPFFFPEVKGVDPSLYHEWAKELAAGYWPGDKLLYGHPFYPYLVSLFYRFWAIDAYSIIVIQFLIGAVSCVLLYFIGRRVFNPAVGIISSFIAALYGPFLFYEGLLLPSALSIFLNLTVLIMLFNMDFSSRPFTLLIGLLLGCSLASASGIAPFILILILWIFLSFRKAGKKAVFLHLVCFLMGVIIPTAVMSFKHFAVEGHFDLFGAHGGINFYIGNNPKAKGNFAAPAGFTPSAEALSEDSSRYARAILGQKATINQVSGFWYAKAFGYIKAHPFLWLKLLCRKFILFWNAFEIGDVADYYICKNDSFLLKFNPFTFGLIAPLGLAGMALAGRFFRKAFLLYAGIASFMISSILFFVNSRYRVPAVPYLIIFAAFAVLSIWQRYKAGDYGRLWAYIIIVSLFFIFSNIKAIDADTITPFYNLSVIYAKKGDYDKAIDISKKLLRRDPNISMVHFNLGVCYYSKGMRSEAIYEFQEALRLNPKDRNARFNLGVMYYEDKNYGKALDEFKESLTGGGEDVLAHYNLGRVYEDIGDLQNALVEYEAALKAAPEAIQIKKACEGIIKRIKPRQKKI